MHALILSSTGSRASTHVIGRSAGINRPLLAVLGIADDEDAIKSEKSFL
jgi:hypothetical protein